MPSPQSNEGVKRPSVGRLWRQDTNNRRHHQAWVCLCSYEGQEETLATLLKILALGNREIKRGSPATDVFAELDEKDAQ